MLRETLEQGLARIAELRAAGMDFEADFVEQQVIEMLAQEARS